MRDRGRGFVSAGRGAVQVPPPLRTSDVDHVLAVGVVYSFNGKI